MVVKMISNNKMIITFTALLLFFASAAVHVYGQTTYDVTKYGARADGASDISQALLKAWEEACASSEASRIVIPSGTYALGEILISGPCKGPIGFVVQGTIKAPADASKIQGTGWIAFERIDQFSLSGGGIFDGQGASAWAKDCVIFQNQNCKQQPISLRFDFITNGIVKDITSKDSKQFHINVMGCNNLTFEHVTISAAADSSNTDGIHIGRSSGVNISDTSIQTGDDCISIGDGSEQINIEKVTCGLGHGISIGSLGFYANEKPVIGVHVKNCTITNTMNGLRIKTWASQYQGSASNLHYQDIIMNNVSNPILIDQEYCPHNNCNLKIASLIQLSDISFQNIKGTTPDVSPVKLICSQRVPCKQVQLKDIDLALAFNGDKPQAEAEAEAEAPSPALSSVCKNIKPILLGGVHLPPPCV